jgi:predicted DNA-binding transcriptional regulator AlpA
MPSPEDLVGRKELVVILGVSKQSVARYVNREDFPRPVERIAAGPIWRRGDVERWAKEHLPLPTGRPRKGKPPTP